MYFIVFNYNVIQLLCKWFSECWHNEKQVEWEVDGKAEDASEENENPDNCVAFALKTSPNYEFNPNLGDRNCCRTARFECC